MVDNVTGVPVMALMDPRSKSHPVPARNPAITGWGMNLISPPNLKAPRAVRKKPVARVETMTAATTVINVCSAVAPFGMIATIDAAINARMGAILFCGTAIVPG